MRNRLEAAKELLAQNGVIVVQINDKEQAHLKVLMDEIFDQNYQGTIVVKMSHLSGTKMSHKEKKIIKTIEYLHVFSLQKKIKINPQYIATSWEKAFGRYISFIVKSEENPSDITQWKVIPLNKAIQNANINSSDIKEKEKFLMSHADCIFRTVANRSKNHPKKPGGGFLEVGGVLTLDGEEVELTSKKIRPINGVETPTAIVGDLWLDIGINNVFQEGGEDIRLRNGKKPEMLLERIIRTFTEEGDIVLDFFAGTGTTAAVAHKLKRQWLAIEQLDYISTLTVPRLKNVICGDQTGISKSANWQGGGSFIYAELAASNATFCNDISVAERIDVLTKIYANLQETGFLRHDLDLSMFETKEFTALPLEDVKRVLMDCLDANHLYVNLGSLGDKEFDISDEDVATTRSFYGIRE